MIRSKKQTNIICTPFYPNTEIIICYILDWKETTSSLSFLSHGTNTTLSFTERTIRLKTNMFQLFYDLTRNKLKKKTNGWVSIGLCLVWHETKFNMNIVALDTFLDLDSCGKVMSHLTHVLLSVICNRGCL